MKDDKPKKKVAQDFIDENFYNCPFCDKLCHHTDFHWKECRLKEAMEKEDESN